MPGAIGEKRPEKILATEPDAYDGAGTVNATLDGQSRPGDRLRAVVYTVALRFDPAEAGAVADLLRKQINAGEL